MYNPFWNTQWANLHHYHFIVFSIMNRTFSEYGDVLFYTHSPFVYACKYIIQSLFAGICKRAHSFMFSAIIIHTQLVYT